ncbi:solute carrier family 53 member 1-like [Oscarella lobularis]|uniref:solute carrier family 53 member 1-like n=1 Tax=Oscarella lobularis TaxID=121494 RepID=UPI003313E318
MKFNRRLQAHLTPEWRKQYIAYGRLRELIYAAQDSSPSQGDVQAYEEYFEEVEKDYMNEIKLELDKVEKFFKARELMSKSKFATLKSEAEKLKRLSLSGHQEVRITHEEAMDLWSNAVKVGKGGEKTKSVKRAHPKHNRTRITKSHVTSRLKALKLAFSEFYLDLILLQQYQVLNREGFRKILKKHDKEWRTSTGLTFHLSVIMNSYFVTSVEIDNLILQVETVSIETLEGGNRRRAMNRLRVPALESDRVSHSSTFFLGLNVGMSTVLIVVAVLVGVFLANFQSPVSCKTDYSIRNYTLYASNGSFGNQSFGNESYGNENCISGDWVRVSAVKMFRGSLYVALIITLIGVNTLGWRMRGVNHVLIFEVNPRDHLTAYQLMGIGTFMFVTWLTCLIGFFVTCQCWSGKFAFLWPIAVWVIYLLYALNPIKILQYSSRKWFLKIFRRIVCAPFYSVNFPDFWLADQWTSMGGVLLDFYFTVCFFIHMWDKDPGDQNCTICTSVGNGIRPLLAGLPSWFRFAQCVRRYNDTRKFFPHAVNAGKYLTGVVEVIFSALYHHYKETGGAPQTGPFFYAWIVSFVIVFVYKLYWDLVMDWGLMKAKYGFLREELIYRLKALYYVAIVEDAILRLLWILKVTVFQTDADRFRTELLGGLVSVLELIRRFVWNFFRLENEHLNNCGEFRATRDISIKPLSRSDKKEARDDANVEAERSRPVAFAVSSV